MRLFGYVIKKYIQISLYMNEKVTYLAGFLKVHDQKSDFSCFCQAVFRCLRGRFFVQRAIPTFGR